MSGKSRGGFGIGRSFQVGWSILSPQPVTPLCGQPGISVLGMALGKLASCHCPPATLPEPRQKAAPSPHLLICHSSWHLPWPLSPRSGACWPAPWGDPHQGGPQCCICLQNLLGLAQVVSWAHKPPFPIMCLIVPSIWDLKTSGARRRVGLGPPLLCLVPLIFMGPGPWPCLPTCHSLAFWLTFYPQDSGHSKGGGHSCDITPGCRVRALGRKKASKALSPWCPA